MPSLRIDNIETEVPEGTKVIEAAERIGIVIPRLCYHPALGSVGACRVCAVNFQDGPVKGIEMSCMIDAQDGMDVSTTDQKAVDFRRQVIEWLMLNHPHDCPVCDEGGHCILQEMTVSGGHGIRRYSGKKRTYTDQFLGPLVQHEMNRCIHCYRCVRYYQEFSGYHDLGVMGIGSRVYFGRFQEGNLKSPFSGNLIDICPTGVYTDKPSRYTGRRWDFERKPSVCIHCSLGCHITVSTRYRKIVRQEARLCPEINGYFICDRGRYGFDYANDNDRPRQARIAEKTATTEESLTKAVRKFQIIADQYGHHAVAAIGSGRSGMETLAALQHLCRKQDWQEPAFWKDEQQFRNVRTAVFRYTEKTAASLSELEKADLIIVLGADIINEAPMAALAIRQTVRNNGKVFVADPRPIELPFAFEKISIPPDQLELLVSWLAVQGWEENQLNQFEEAVRNHIGSLSLPAFSTHPVASMMLEMLQESKRIVFILGMDLISPMTILITTELAKAEPQKSLKHFYLFPEANSFGAALIDEAFTCIEKVVSGIENDIIKALIVVEKALSKLEYLVVMDYINTKTARTADILIPTKTIYETSAVFINQEGRIQETRPVFQGGIPIEQTGKGNHPPRSFLPRIPGNDIQAAWQMLWKMIEKDKPMAEESIRKSIHRKHPILSKLGTDQKSDNGRIGQNGNPMDKAPVEFFSQYEIAPSGFHLLLTGTLFDSEILSGYSSCLQQLNVESAVYMASEDAIRLQLAEGDTIQIGKNEETIQVPLKISPNMARGCLVLFPSRNFSRRLFNDKIQVSIGSDHYPITKVSVC